MFTTTPLDRFAGARVTILTDFLNELAGTERYTATLAETLARRGATVDIVVGDPIHDPTWRDILSERGVAVHAQDASGGSGGIGPRLDHHIAIRRPDLILANPIGRALTEWLPTVPETLRVPPLIGVEYSQPGPLSNHWYPPELPKVINRLDAVITTCATSSSGVVDHFGYRGAVHVIPHLVEAPRRRLPPALPRAHLGLVARISVEKGLDYALAALALLVRAGVDVELSIYGAGRDDNEDRVHELAICLGISGVVHLRGPFHPVSDLDDVLQRHALWLQPSLFEAVPTAMLELFARGRTVIASAVGGIPELLDGEVQGADLLVPAGDTRALADRILDCLRRERHFNRLTKKVQAAVLARHDPVTVVPKLLATLQSHLRRPAIPGGDARSPEPQHVDQQR